MVSLFGWIFKGIEVFWINLRQFAYRNRTIFELLFIILYASEQAALIILTFILPQYMLVLVSLFAVLVLSTFSFHKLLIESRIKMLEEGIADLKGHLMDIASEAENIHTRYEEIRALRRLQETKGLNKKSSKNK